jgi:hypothetical protein
VRINAVVTCSALFCRFPLQVSGTKDVAFHIPLESKKKAVFRYKVRLPPYITCTQCVIQWTYYTGKHSLGHNSARTALLEGGMCSRGRFTFMSFLYGYFLSSHIDSA